MLTMRQTHQLREKQEGDLGGLSCLVIANMKELGSTREKNEINKELSGFLNLW